MNLIPVHRRDAANRRRRVNRWLAGGAVYSALLLVICAWIQMSGGQDRAVALEMSSANGQAANLQRSVLLARSELSNATAAHSTLATLADPPDWSLLLIGLPSLAGNTTVLRDMHLVPQQIAVSADPQQAFEVRIGGICRSQAEFSSFLQRLQNVGLFSRVELLHSGREAFENGAGVAFEIRCVIGNGVPGGSDNQ